MQSLEKVKEILAEELALDASNIADNANVMEDLNADSLDVVEIIMRVEEEFDIVVPDEESEKLTTVGQIALYVDDAVKGK